MSTCQDDISNLNKLYSGNNGKQTLILDYGPYMN